MSLNSKRLQVNSQFITEGKLKDSRNWTDSVIKCYLGAPVTVNRHKVYPMSEVLKAEQKPGFRKWMLKRISGQSQKAQEVHEYTIESFIHYNLEIALSERESFPFDVFDSSIGYELRKDFDCKHEVTQNLVMKLMRSEIRNYAEKNQGKIFLN